MGDAQKRQSYGWVGPDAPSLNAKAPYPGAFLLLGDTEARCFTRKKAQHDFSLPITSVQHRGQQVKEPLYEP